MTDPVYRQLAERLDAIPNGFPATESGVELRLLAYIFTPEEAALAAVMKLTRESPAAIAARAGVDAKAAKKMLKAMARQGLILAGRGEGGLSYGLMPFVVGIYEEQLGRMDATLAALFEQYYLESRGGLVRQGPAVHRVIPVEEAVPVNISVLPYESASQMVDNAQAWGVRDCICRVQKQLIGEGCEHPLETCLIFAPVAGIFDHSDITRAISKEEAHAILQEAADAGLVHSPGNYRDGTYYICNCCTCSCGVLRNVTEHNMPTAVARADFLAVVDADICSGCEDCSEQCQFSAIMVGDEGVAEVNEMRCVGCGQCVTVCTTGALSLTRRPAGQVAPPPVDHAEWLAQRAASRGLSLDEMM